VVTLMHGAQHRKDSELWLCDGMNRKRGGNIGKDKNYVKNWREVRNNFKKLSSPKIVHCKRDFFDSLFCKIDSLPPQNQLTIIFDTLFH